MNAVSPATQPASRVRYGVLAFACALSMITYLDRVCFGAAAEDIVKAPDSYTGQWLSQVLASNGSAPAK